jgi:hypothetical protein
MGSRGLFSANPFSSNFPNSSVSAEKSIDLLMREIEQFKHLSRWRDCRIFLAETLVS